MKFIYSDSIVFVLAYRTINRRIETHQSTVTSLTANNMTVKLTNQVNNQRHKYQPLTVQHHKNSEDDYR